MATKKEDVATVPVRPPEAALVPKAPSGPERRSPGEWAGAKGTKAWALAGATQHFQWAKGLTLTEAQFDGAIKKVASLKFSSPAALVRKAKTTKRGKRWLSRV